MKPMLGRACSIIILGLYVTACGSKSPSEPSESDAQGGSGSPSSAKVGVSQAKDLPKNVRAFLDVIAYAEGTHEKYNISYGGSQFTGYNDHPRKYRSSPWGTPGVGSDAAGRYQFKSTTWDEARRIKKLSDFSPANQDKAAVYLIERLGGSAMDNVQNATTRSRFNSALLSLSHTWASLPPQRYKNQKVKSSDELWVVYQKALAAYR